MSRIRWIKLAKGFAFCSIAIFLGVLTASFAYVNSKRFIYGQIKAFTARIDVGSGHGSGVLIKAGKNEALILTNAHVCARMLLLVMTKEDVAKSDFKTLFHLPLKKGVSALIAGYNVPVKKIVKVSPEDDLCLIEVDGPVLNGYGAELATDDLNDYSEYINASASYPLSHILTVSKGLYVGEMGSSRPRLSIDPVLVKSRIEADLQMEELQLQYYELMDKMAGLTQREQVLREKNPKVVAKQLQELQEKATQYLMDLQVLMFKKEIINKGKVLASFWPASYRKDNYFNWPTYPGCSGSGVWTSSGKLIGLIWGQATDVNQGIAIQLIDIKEFLSSPKYFL